MHADGAHGISTEQLDALRASVCTRAAGCRHFIPLLFCAAAAAAAVPPVVALGGIAAGLPGGACGVGGLIERRGLGFDFLPGGSFAIIGGAGSGH